MPDVDPSHHPKVSPEAATDLRLVVDLPPRLSNFASNAWVFFQRRPAVIADGSAFWPDVLVPGGVPRRGLLHSAGWHALMIAALFGLSKLPAHPGVTPARIFDHSTITYYRVSDELPAFDSQAQPNPAPIARKADPLPAPQEIVSLPPNPENFRQRIITPDLTPLKSEQALPNLMAWNPALPAAPPVSGAQKLASVWKVVDHNTIVAPAPDSGSNLAAASQIPLQTAVAPPPDAGSSAAPAAELPVRAAVGPPVADVPAALADQEIVLPRRPVIGPPSSDIESPYGTVVDASAAAGRTPLPPPAKPAAQSAAGGQNPGNHGGSETSAAPNAGVGNAVIIGLHPTPPSGPLEVPRASLNGAFAGSPNGRPEATGLPELVAGGNGAGANGASKATVPSAGLLVRGSTAPSTAPVVVAAAAPPPSPIVPRALKPNMFAMRKPSVEELARSTAPGLEDDVRPEDEVFHSRHYYSLTLNMPNFTSASGSWVIRFAAADKSRPDDDLQPPVALVKVDPAYPLELMRAGVEGSVTLYAVIHADGSVGEVRVLHGVNQRLDDFARTALTGWKFQPATRHGNAVELEAVVQIPFHPSRQAY